MQRWACPLQHVSGGCLEKGWSMRERARVLARRVRRSVQPTTNGTLLQKQLTPIAAVRRHSWRRRRDFSIAFQIQIRNHSKILNPWFSSCDSLLRSWSARWQRSRKKSLARVARKVSMAKCFCAADLSMVVCWNREAASSPWCGQQDHQQPSSGGSVCWCRW